jgi:hypothetical protein
MLACGITTAVGLLWTSGLAGAHGGDSSQVHACVVPASGTIRVIQPTESCRSNETALDWARSSGGTYRAGYGLALNGNEFSVTRVDWSDLDGIPSGFADEIDDDASTEVDGLRSDLAGGALSIVHGSSIQSGSIRALQLAGEYTDDDFNPSTPPVQSIPGAVTSEKILDGTISARDLNSALMQRIEALEAQVAALRQQNAGG